MAEKLGVAVAGAGIGWFHMAAIMKAAAEGQPVKLAAVCDMKDAAAKAALAKAASEMGLPMPEDVALVSGFDELLEAKDALGLGGVTIALPNCLHTPCSIGALEAGLHVLCEKPLSDTLDGARTMAEAATSHPGQRAMMVLNNSVRPEMDFVLGLVANGGGILRIVAKWVRDKGIPFRTRWFGCKQFSGAGPLIDLATHNIGQAMTVTGWPRVRAVTGWKWTAPDVDGGSCDGPYGGGGSVSGDCSFDVETAGMMVATLDVGGKMVPLTVETSWGDNIPGEEMSLAVYCRDYRVEMKRVWPVNDGDDRKAVDTLKVIGKMRSPSGIWTPYETVINPYGDLAAKDPWMGRIRYIQHWLNAVLDPSVEPVCDFTRGLMIQGVINAWLGSNGLPVVFD